MINKTITIQPDNQPVVQANRKHELIFKWMMILIKNLVVLCVQHSIHFSDMCIPGCENILSFIFAIWPFSSRWEVMVHMWTYFTCTITLIFQQHTFHVWKYIIFYIFNMNFSFRQEVMAQICNYFVLHPQIKALQLHLYWDQDRDTFQSNDVGIINFLQDIAQVLTSSLHTLYT